MRMVLVGMVVKARTMRGRLTRGAVFRLRILGGKGALHLILRRHIERLNCQTHETRLWFMSGKGESASKGQTLVMFDNHEA